MRDRPELDDTTITVALREAYGIATSALSFLPLGADSASFAYRVDTADGASYFLKVRSSAGFSEASLAVSRYLQDSGMPHIAAPLRTLAQTLWVSAADFALSLYPFIDGRTGVEAGLSDAHWRELGATVRQIHASRLTPDLMRVLQRESYIPSRREVLTMLPAILEQQSPTSPLARELAAFCDAHRAKLDRLVARADALGRRLRQAAAPLVLCHADFHNWNVLLDSAGQLWVVDWDETILAPKERDLMFVMRGIGRDLVKPHETVCFLQGYGDAAIDATALTYYRYAWAVQDMGAYAEEAVLMPDRSAESHRDGVRGFMSLFEPGNIADIAFASDDAEH
ncbi:MAG: aminoglycoside phosphotransferase family protein [Chloroflexi bacterium]|nr:aminoglycoside phosphotransferase family protein [Chloroflexota bacterium]MCL5273130.1 aminoglycoside phosphotransferase family protein [Chloroflexota bacterium]